MVVQFEVLQSWTAIDEHVIHFPIVGTHTIPIHSNGETSEILQVPQRTVRNIVLDLFQSHSVDWWRLIFKKFGLIQDALIVDLHINKSRARISDGGKEFRVVRDTDRLV
jgi:hypothetical protein